MSKRPVTVNDKDNLFSFVKDANIYDLSTSYRWQGINMIRQENTAEHSYYVSLFVMLICEALNLTKAMSHSALRYAILHDYDEVHTGDIRHSLKYQTSIGEELRTLLSSLTKEKMDGLEDRPYNRSLKEIPQLEADYPVKKIVKTADWLSMYFIMEREIEMGNHSVSKHFEYCKQELIKHSEELKELFGDNKITNDIQYKFL